MKKKFLIIILSISIMIALVLFGCNSIKNKNTANSATTEVSTTELTIEDKTAISEEVTTEEVTVEEPTTEEPTTEEPTTEKPTPAPTAGVTSKGFEIEIRNGVTYVGGILIANKTYSLPANYNPYNLQTERDLEPDTLAAFNRMKAAAALDGLNLKYISGFRSYYTQDWLYNHYVSRDGQVKADLYSARPGHSEHQTGLAFDLSPIDAKFATMPEGIWVAAHCHEYGFIIRYAEDKTEQTGYGYEPWHLRYLGVDMATAVYNSGLSLEEYLGIDSKYAN